MTDYKKLAAKTAQEVYEAYSVKPEPAAKAYLKPEQSPGEFSEALIAAGEDREAVNFLAFALPRREGTWWACLAARSTLGENNEEPSDPATLQAAEAWVYKPNDENRRAALKLGMVSSGETPASLAALAAGWSGGSMGPPDADSVPPAKDASPRAIAGAVIVAAVSGAPEAIPERFRTALSQGLDIAAGGNGMNIEEGT
jgi:hypothetical protein